MSSGNRKRANYVKRTGDMICEAIALGKTLQEALDEVGYLAPTIPVFWRWLEANPDFRDQYERARQLSADMDADKIKEMAAKVLNNPRAAGAYKVASDILKWTAEVRNSAAYGKKRESKAKKPLDPGALRSEIRRLERELGIAEASKVVPLPAKKDAA